MPRSNRPVDVPPAVAREGLVKRDGRGRPPKGKAPTAPMKSIIRRMPTGEEMYDKDGLAGADLLMLAKIMALKHVILLESVYEAPDESIDLLKKVDVANKAIGLIDKLRDGWRDAGAEKPKYPHTEQAIDDELQRRIKNIVELDKAIKNPDPAVAEKIFDRLTPVQLEATE